METDLTLTNEYAGGWNDYVLGQTCEPDSLAPSENREAYLMGWRDAEARVS